MLYCLRAMSAVIEEQEMFAASVSQEQVVLKAELTAESQQTCDPDASSHPY